MAKSRRKRKVDTVDLGTDESKNHGIYELDAGVVRLRNQTVDVISMYKKRGWISKEQYDVAELFHVKFRTAGMIEKYAKLNLDGIRYGHSDDGYTDSVVQSRQEIKLISDYIGRPLINLLIHTCGLGCPAGTWQGVSNYSRREEKAMTMLKISLDALIDYFSTKK
jgi:hypothetical protein